MEKQKMICPLCEGRGELTEDEIGHWVNASNFRRELQQLRKKGILAETMFVAVKMVETINDKPMWFKGLLDEHRSGLCDKIAEGNSNLVNEIRGYFNEMSKILNNPLKVGLLQERTIPKRLKAIAPQDTFEGKGHSGVEDVLCSIDGINEKIVIESKRVTKRFSYSWLDQTKKNMKKKNTKFGILATSTMPSDSLSYTTWIKGVLVVQVDHVELAYLFMRKYVILKDQLEHQYESRIKGSQVKEKILSQIREAIMNSELDSLIEEIKDITEIIDNNANKAEKYMATYFKRQRESTKLIRSLMNGIVENHIRKIKIQLG